MCTHLLVDSPHEQAPSEGLNDDGGPAGPPVGQAGPPHTVLLLEHDGCSGPPQMLSQPGEEENRQALLTEASKPFVNASLSPLSPAWTLPAEPVFVTLAEGSDTPGTRSCSGQLPPH